MRSYRSCGLDYWDRIWNRRDGIPHIRAPRFRDVVRMMLRSPDVQLRPHPWQPKKSNFSSEGNDLGVPARVFPQWLRCTNHAKFLAIDHRFLLVTSANFSWSAEHGNAEFGVLVDNRNLTEAVEREMRHAEDRLYEHVPMPTAQRST